MCGIVGVAGKINNKEEKVLKTLLILDSVRGIDSTGIAAIPKFGDVRVVKQLGNPYELFETRGYAPAINRPNRAIIGHNRFATQGEVNRKNAHPFDFDTLVGVHNGTLRNKYKLLDSNLFKVDSENLYYHIENEGLDSFLEIVDGAYALVWWDKVNESLCFLRNKERPLWCVKSLDGETIFWASERWMLEVAIGREDINIGEFHCVMEDMLYTININDKGVMDKPQVSPAASKYVPPVYHTNHNPGWKGHQGVVGNQKKLILVENKTHTSQSTYSTQTQTTTTIPSATEKKSVLQHSIASRKYYVSSKGLSFEIMAECSDENGASFLALFDKQEPHIKIRLYLKRNDPLYGKVGSFIIGDIKDVHISPKDGAYYKVGYSSVKLVEEAEDIDLADIPVKNHRGKEISQTEFIQTYSCCGCCDGFVDPQAPYKFTVSGEAICSSCLSTPEAIKYIALA